MRLNGKNIYLSLLKGDKGDKGEQGIQGEKGECILRETTTAIATNSAGINVLVSTITPSDNIKVGDILMSTTDTTEYNLGRITEVTTASVVKVAYIGTFKGEKGEQGEQGIQGEQGVQGIQGIQGEQGEKGECVLRTTAAQIVQGAYNIRILASTITPSDNIKVGDCIISTYANSVGNVGKVTQVGSGEVWVDGVGTLKGDMPTDYLPNTGGTMKGDINLGTQYGFVGTTTSGNAFDIFRVLSSTGTLQVGGSYPALELKGKNTRPNYNDSPLALLSDVSTSSYTACVATSGTSQGYIDFKYGNGTLRYAFGVGDVQNVVTFATPFTTLLWANSSDQSISDARSSRTTISTLSTTGMTFLAGASVPVRWEALGLL